MNLDTGKIFVSARAASDFYGLRPRGVASQINAGQRVKGYRLVYAVDPFVTLSAAYGERKKKPVLRLSDGAKFPSAKEAALSLGLKKNGVNVAIARGTKAAGSYWKYL